MSNSRPHHSNSQASGSQTRYQPTSNQIINQRPQYQPQPMPRQYGTDRAQIDQQLAYDLMKQKHQEIHNMPATNYQAHNANHIQNYPANGVNYRHNSSDRVKVSSTGARSPGRIQKQQQQQQQLLQQQQQQTYKHNFKPVLQQDYTPTKPDYKSQHYYQQQQHPQQQQFGSVERKRPATVAQTPAIIPDDQQQQPVSYQKYQQYSAMRETFSHNQQLARQQQQEPFQAVVSDPPNNLKPVTLESTMEKPKIRPKPIFDITGSFKEETSSVFKKNDSSADFVSQSVLMNMSSNQEAQEAQKRSNSKPVETQQHKPKIYPKTNKAQGIKDKKYSVDQYYMESEPTKRQNVHDVHDQVSEQLKNQTISHINISTRNQMPSQTLREPSHFSTIKKEPIQASKNPSICWSVDRASQQAAQENSSILVGKFENQTPNGYPSSTTLISNSSRAPSASGPKNKPELYAMKTLSLMKTLCKTYQRDQAFASNMLKLVNELERELDSDFFITDGRADSFLLQNERETITRGGASDTVTILSGGSNNRPRGEICQQCGNNIPQFVTKLKQRKRHYKSEYKTQQQQARTMVGVIESIEANCKEAESSLKTSKVECQNQKLTIQQLASRVQKLEQELKATQKEVQLKETELQSFQNTRQSMNSQQTAEEFKHLVSECTNYLDGNQGTPTPQKRLSNQEASPSKDMVYKVLKATKKSDMTQKAFKKHFKSEQDFQFADQNRILLYLTEITQIYNQSTQEPQTRNHINNQTSSKTIYVDKGMHLNPGDDQRTRMFHKVANNTSSSASSRQSSPNQKRKQMMNMSVKESLGKIINPQLTNSDQKRQQMSQSHSFYNKNSSSSAQSSRASASATPQKQKIVPKQQIKKKQEDYSVNSISPDKPKTSITTQTSPEPQKIQESPQKEVVTLQSIKEMKEKLLREITDQLDAKVQQRVDATLQNSNDQIVLKEPKDQHRSRKEECTSPKVDQNQISLQPSSQSKKPRLIPKSDRLTGQQKDQQQKNHNFSMNVSASSRQQVADQSLSQTKSKTKTMLRQPSKPPSEQTEDQKPKIRPKIEAKKPISERYEPGPFKPTSHEEEAKKPQRKSSANNFVIGCDGHAQNISDPLYEALFSENSKSNIGDSSQHDIYQDPRSRKGSGETSNKPKIKKKQVQKEIEDDEAIEMVQKKPKFQARKQTLDQKGQMDLAQVSEQPVHSQKTDEEKKDPFEQGFDTDVDLRYSDLSDKLAMAERLFEQSSKRDRELLLEAEQDEDEGAVPKYKPQVQKYAASGNVILNSELDEDLPLGKQISSHTQRLKECSDEIVEEAEDEDEDDEEDDVSAALNQVYARRNQQH